MIQSDQATQFAFLQLLEKINHNRFLKLIVKIQTFAPTRVSEKTRKFLVASQKVNKDRPESAHTQIEFLPIDGTYSKFQILREKITKTIKRYAIQWTDRYGYCVLIDRNYEKQLTAELTTLKQEFDQLKQEIKNNLQNDINYLEQQYPDEELSQEIILKRIDFNNNVDKHLNFEFFFELPPNYNITITDFIAAEASYQNIIISNYQRFETLGIAPMVALMHNCCKLLTAERLHKDTIDAIAAEFQIKTETISKIIQNLAQKVDQERLYLDDQLVAIDQNLTKFFTEFMPQNISLIASAINYLQTLKSSRQAKEELPAKEWELLYSLYQNLDYIFKEKPYAVGSDNTHVLESVREMVYKKLAQTIQHIHDQLFEALAFLENCVTDVVVANQERKKRKGSWKKELTHHHVNLDCILKMAQNLLKTDLAKNYAEVLTYITTVAKQLAQQITLENLALLNLQPRDVVINLQQDLSAIRANIESQIQLAEQKQKAQEMLDQSGLEDKLGLSPQQLGGTSV